MNNNLLSKHAKSFNWAGFFLNKEKYKKCSMLYDFCRTLDDIADEESDLETKKNKFLQFKSDFVNKNYNNLIIKNMWLLIDEEKISLKIIYDLFDGVKSDIKPEILIKNKKDLFVYSYRVAGTVGLMMSKILKIYNKDSLKGAIDLGIAMQLTNIARDVIEDKKRNRKYINHDFNTIKETIKIAETFYESSFPSIKSIPFSFRFSIIVARRIYRKIGYNIVKKKNIENYNNAGKIYVSNFTKLLETFLSFLDLLKLIFINSKEHLKKSEHLLINEVINLDERI
jgi:phytoene synthase|tara:strand:+ start:2680 stop:3528 length:849 start_codon:yes stop_codon:yes gene_type:complete